MPQASGPDWAKIDANRDRMQAMCGVGKAVIRKMPGGTDAGLGEKMSDYTCDFKGKRS